MANSLNTITVDGVTYNSEAYAATQKIAEKSNELGKDAFLQLLVTQLQYQDPLDPQDNGEFISQMAQFTSLEQMTNVANGLEKVSKVVSNIDTSVLVGQLSSMIGKSVDWIETIESADEEGNPLSTTESFSVTITGVTVSEGSTRVVAVDAEGTVHHVDIANIAHLYKPEGVKNNRNKKRRPMDGAPPALRA